VARINVGDVLLGGSVGIAGALSGLSKEITVLLAVSVIVLKIVGEQLWRKARDGKDG
jgi:hypothetical protein